MRLRSVVSIGVLCGLVAAACGAGGDDAPGRSATAPGQVVSEVRRAKPSSDAPVAQVVAGLERFTWDFQRLVGSGSENLVFSPASIGMAFAMAHPGADGETRATLEEAFGFPSAPRLYEAMNALLRQLDDVTGDDLTLAAANRGWAQVGRRIGQEYLDTLARHFGAGLNTLDLQGDPTASRQLINEWVAEQTRDRIPELLPDGFINRRTVYVLVNTIYLKATWDQVFGKYPTAPAAFARTDGSSVQVDMMHNAELRGRYLVEDGLQVVELPYAGGDLAMRVAVPEDLGALEAGLDGDEWDRISGALREGTIDVSLPKWDFGISIDLAPPLGELGIEIPGGVYSRIAPGLFLGQAVHGANITVDEEGTEAAAGTALGFEESGPPSPDAVIRADRPFVFTIVHQPTGLILFAGHVADPTA